MPHGSRAGPGAARLREMGLKVTEQRLALLSLLFDRGDRHVTAEGLHREARDAGLGVALATVYNTLHALAEHGLLRAIVVDAHRTYFDTNTEHGCHLYREDTGELSHLGEEVPALRALLRHIGGPPPDRVDILIRLRAARPAACRRR
jgi:Fur family iron response transcriptional regulator